MKRHYWFAPLLLFLIQKGYAQNWTQLYGPTIRFDVYREGKKVGEYTTTFKSVGSAGSVENVENGWKIDSKMTLTLQVFLFFHYKYHYTDSERWQNGRLQQIHVLESRNGVLKQLDAKAEGDVLKGQGQSGAIHIPLPVLTTTHYNAAVLHQQSVLNTLSGKLDHYQLKAMGQEKVLTNKGLVNARKYQYSGDIQNTFVWYTPRKHWVKLWFKADDGSGIELRCVHCIK